ncbi:MAG: two-component sensor histidine kinase [Yaniella sp.]|uniref:histidine kinase n=1 Tax=Glutamicibacter arilaitensis (strain DSM 16368 / CIP 108037 / IAM 15318 / JCM 13566 / NCIMB 14258 / Re117) TaxID=861360 RepID=A0ABM9PTU5_GLUAR|nr:MULTISPECIES: histidine kinase [Micrococcaceae]MDN5818209.1 two-component sensor histidine kinase [Yaniella sp.]MDN5838095.1 two-component sensor histidine kinase [Yaniella sp.]MDN5889107.1 two-component sensor histidine kinase [Yaniella sp.]MDN5912243.1 two-component sensor histidine kinase [Yaniella sp.]MDN6171735.1 two-component sensor histidine kinase [Yaniella sp.]
MNSSLPQLTGLDPKPAERSRVLTVTIVGGLSVLVGGFYIWAIQLAAQSDAQLVTPQVWAYVVWAAGTVIAAGLLWWHQRYPIIVFAAVFALHLTGAVLLGNGGLGGVALPLWFSVYALAAFARPRIALTLVAGAWIIAALVQFLLAAAAGLSLTAPEAVVAALGQGFFFVACFMIGLGMRAQRHRARDAAERAELAEARTRAETAEAISRERNRMARELHDLAAHQIMDVLLTTRAALLTDPHPVLESIEHRTAEALDNVRSVVGALREADADTPDQPLADGATHVITQVARERNLHVEHNIQAVHEPPPALIATTLSVLTEALVNAATHAPGMPVTVTLHSNIDAVTLHVRNSLAPHAITTESDPPDSGYGLIGAAERAHILNGSVTTGIDTNGDWVLSLTLPHLHNAAEVSQ